MLHGSYARITILSAVINVLILSAIRRSSACQYCDVLMKIAFGSCLVFTVCILTTPGLIIGSILSSTSGREHGNLQNALAIAGIRT